MSIMQDDKILANDVLQRHFYKDFQSENGIKFLQIFLIGACHANCEYCYLKKNMKDLYPISIHNIETILNNTQLILNWYIENQFKCNIQIFSAEWLTTPIADKVIDIFYNTFKDSEYKPKALIAPDNMQFLKSEETLAKVENYIEKLHSIGIEFALSASVDGKICEYGRTLVDDVFYDRLKYFVNKYKILPHPMISANNIKDWIANYKWWKQEFGKETVYNMTILEVRNEDWTYANIEDLITFCDFLVDDTFKDLNENKEDMLKYIFHVRKENDLAHFNDCYNPIRFIYNNFTKNVDKFSCSTQNMLSIRAGDLMVAPCHRTHYPLLEFGQYNIENNKITDFNPKNVSLLIAHKYFKRSCLPICEQCGLVGICPGFCMGASYEEYKDILIPQKEVCDMYRAKYVFLIYKYHTMGLLDDLSVLKEYFEEEDIQYFKDLFNSVLEELI